MSAKFQALLNTKTWNLVPPSPSANVLGVKWVFKTKRRFDGKIERRKACLVAKGFHQLPSVNYAETFSPMAKPSTIRLLLSFVAMYRWSTPQLDIQNAFLHGSLEETVYIVQPPGFVNPSFPHHIFKLNRSLYGLKQVPRVWFSRLSDPLFSMEFSSSPTDTSLFSYGQGFDCIFILVYVDDLLVVSSNPDLSAKFVLCLSKQFPVRDLGPANFFLRIEITMYVSGFNLCQSKHILDLVAKAGMTYCRSVSTPIATNYDASVASPLFEDASSIEA